MIVQESAVSAAPRADERALAWLAGEMPAWLRDGLLTEDQAKRIRARYDFVGVELERRAGPGRLVQAVSVLGALLVGAGVLTWVAANWDGMPDAVRLLMIFGSVAGFHWGGYELAFRRGTHPYVGQALLFVGSACYGAGIFLVAQMFHLSGEWTNAFLAWGLGALGVAVAVESAPVFAIAAGALSIWGVGRAENPGVSGLLGLAAIAALLAVAYVRRSKAHVTIAVLAAGVWLALVPPSWGKSESLLPVAWLAGSAILVSVGVLHRALGRDDLASPWRAAGICGGMFTLFLLSIRFVSHELAWRSGVPEPGALPVVLLGAAALAGVALLIGRGRGLQAEAGAALGACGLGAAWWLVGSREASTVFSIVSSGALLASAAGLAALGTHERRGWLAWQGLGWFGIGLFTLYVDFGWDLLDKSLFFTGAGALLLATGWMLERQRRRIAGSLREART